MIDLEIFISYFKDQETDSVAEEISKKLISLNFKIQNRYRNLDYKSSIREFINKIASGNCIIILLNDEYIKDEYCMNEILEVKRNRNFWNRIFPIIFDSAKIYDSIERIDYLKFWDDKIEALRDKYKTLNNPVGTQAIVEKINLFSDIRRAIDELIDNMNNMNCLNLTEHKNTGYKKIIEAINIQSKENIKIEINTSIDELKSKIIDKSKKDRLNAIQKNLELNQRLMLEFEKNIIVEDNPEKIKEYNFEILKIKTTIDNLLNEINSIK
jgi:hypothetical protein